MFAEARFCCVIFAVFAAAGQENPYVWQSKWEVYMGLERDVQKMCR
jgi:hypothetical protein